MSDERTLLHDYQQAGSEAAFEKLVRRYVNLVYSTALRQAASQPNLIEDIVQKVFIDFAAEARRSTPDLKIGGWLHRHTCFVAGSTLRTERRRRLREEKTFLMNSPQASDDALWQQIEPILDAAINSLAEKDRLALVLRFFEQRDLRAVGAALGTNADAAQKRVTRALEKLRSILSRQGATLSVTALTTMLASQSLIAAPLTMTASVTAAVLTATCPATAAATPTALTLFSMTKIKFATITAVLAAGVGTSIVIQQSRIAPLQEENAALRAQLAQSSVSTPESSSSLSTNQTTLNHDDFLDLMRLRAEVTQLRAATNDFKKLADENQRLRAAAKTATLQPTPPSALGQFLPRESWTFSGFAQPHAAFQSSVWAMNKGEIDVAAIAWTDEYLERRMKDWAGKSDQEIKEGMTRDFEKVRGFTVNKEELISDTEAIVELGLDAEGEPPIHRARMKKIGDSWKFDGWDKSNKQG